MSQIAQQEHLFVEMTDTEKLLACIKGGVIHDVLLTDKSEETDEETTYKVLYVHRAESQYQIGYANAGAIEEITVGSDSNSPAE